MSSIDRRDLMRVVAGGAAFAAAAPALAAARNGASPAPAPLPADLALERVRTTEVCALGSTAGAIHGEATVGLCRSWDTQVYLQLGKRFRGFVAVDARGFAIASACQAAGRRVAVSAWGHDPDACGGLGRFDGALLAIDARDLPGAEPLGDAS